MFKGIGGRHLGLPPFPSEHACRRERTENEGKLRKTKKKTVGRPSVICQNPRMMYNEV
jgi:hypothetical protein